MLYVVCTLSELLAPMFLSNPSLVIRESDDDQFVQIKYNYNILLVYIIIKIIKEEQKIIIQQGTTRRKRRLLIIILLPHDERVY